MVGASLLVLRLLKRPALLGLVSTLGISFIIVLLKVFGDVTLLGEDFDFIGAERIARVL